MAKDDFLHILLKSGGITSRLERKPDSTPVDNTIPTENSMGCLANNNAAEPMSVVIAAKVTAANVPVLN